VNVETRETIAPKTLQAKASNAYSTHSRASEEEKWILENLPLVRHVVQKVVFHLSHSKEDMEDLIAAGTLGLVKAARAYNSKKDAKFSTYAYIRIRGAVIDELRHRSFVPPNVYNQIRLAKKAYQRCLKDMGHPPTDEQLAARLGIPVRELYRTLEEARKQNFLSIHGLSNEHPVLGAIVLPARGPSPDQQAERKEMLSRLARAITALPERDRLVLLLYYERDLTMKEAAAVLSVTESRFSQLHAGALFKLAMKLGKAK